jgi:hypothetical protein
MKIKIGKLGRRWEGITKMDLKEIGREVVYYIHLRIHKCTERALMKFHDTQRR